MYKYIPKNFYLFIFGSSIVIMFIIAFLSSNSSHTSDEGFQSISDSLDDSLDIVNVIDKEDEDEEAEGGPETAKSEMAVVAEVPTLRRKKNTRQGPRVTRNLGDEKVLSELQDICTNTPPWELYIKVGKEVFFVN